MYTHTHPYIQQTPNTDHPSLPTRPEPFEGQLGQQQNGQDTSCAKHEYDQDQRETEVAHVFPSHTDVTYTYLGEEGEVSSEIDLLRRENQHLRAENSALKQYKEQKLDLLTEKMECFTMEVQALKHRIGQPLGEADVTHRAINNLSVESESHHESESRLKCLEMRVESLEKTKAHNKYHISQLELQLQTALANSCNGTLIWRIPDITQKRRDAIRQPIYSLPFYTGPNGYKMCLCAYLNGNGMGHTTHLSIFLILMKGVCDALLQWPFDHKISFILIDQISHKLIVKTMTPNSRDASFQQPQSDMNVASGYPQFADIAVLENKNYSKDDTIFLKCIVDTSGIYHP